jgi:hypothetical protein
MDYIIKYGENSHKIRRKSTFYQKLFPHLDAVFGLFIKKVKKSFDLEKVFHITCRTATAQLNLNIPYTRRQFISFES